MQIQLGIDRRIIAYYTPTPMSLVGQVIHYFDTYLSSEFNESDASIAQLITVAYLEQRMPLSQLMNTWQSNINYVYLMQHTRMTLDSLRVFIERKRNILLNHLEAISQACGKPHFGAENFELYLMDIYR